MSLIKSLSNLLRDEFNDKATPKSLPETMFLFKCTCGNVHFRHAGYIEAIMPYIQADQEKKVQSDSLSVKVCTSCRKCYVWHHPQWYDVTDKIDIAAWEKTEREMQKCTGPRGNC